MDLGINNIIENYKILQQIEESIRASKDKSVDSIYQSIAQTSATKIGKKRRSKIKAHIQEMLQSRNESASESDIFMRKLQEFGKVDRIEFVSGEKIDLNESPLVLTPFSPKLTLAAELVLSTQIQTWHLILVHRQGKFQKKDILDGLSHAVNHELFVPYAYREGQEFDFFVIYNQINALKKLLAANLKIRVKGEEIKLVVKTAVGTVKTNNKKLADEILEAVNAKMNNDEHILDLSNFTDILESKDIIFSLSNKRCFIILCDQLNGIQKLKESFRVFKFANNNICSLEPLTKLYGFKIDVLDLSNNRIPIQDLELLKCFEIKQLYLAGNEGINLQFFRHKIFGLLPTLVAIDDVPIDAFPTQPVLVEIKKATLKPKFRSGNGAGNDPINQIADGVIIRSNVRKTQEFIHLRNTFDSYRDDRMWTEVTVKHGNAFTWEEILELIIPLFPNQPFFPCYHKRFASHDEFYLYKNFEAVKILMMNNLELVVPPGDKKLIFFLRLNAALFQDGQVDWYHKMNYVLAKKIKGNVLELNNFIEDPEFEKMTVCMTSKYTLEHIVDQAKKQNNQIVRINACRNEMKSLEGLQSLSSFAKLQILDLRENKIFDLAGISLTSSVKELMLDGNPICVKLSDPHEYISTVKGYFCDLEWLDGYHLDKVLDLVTLQNYVVKRDAYTIAEEFIKTFFNIYDSFERHRLLELYNDKSLFTLSVHYDIDRNQMMMAENDGFQRIQKYTRFSRNIKTISNMTKAFDNVFYGVNNIRKVFDELPKTTHDFTSFCIDVPHYESNKIVIITVSGVYSESGQSLNESNFLLGFVRTFILRPAANNTYIISNDQVLIRKPTQAQKEDAAGFHRQPEKRDIFERNCVDLMPTEIEEKKLKLIIFRDLTELKEEECIRQLEETFYDIKVALATFNTLMNSHSIGDEMFDFK